MTKNLKIHFQNRSWQKNIPTIYPMPCFGFINEILPSFQNDFSLLIEALWANTYFPLLLGCNKKNLKNTFIFEAFMFSKGSEDVSRVILIQ